MSIEIRRRGEDEPYPGSYEVKYGELLADALGFDECLGLVASILIRDAGCSPKCLQWLKPPAWDPIKAGA